MNGPTTRTSLPRRLPVHLLAQPRLASWALWLAVVVGALLRLERYLSNRSLWLDESLLALNLREKSLHGVLGTLDYNQSAPAGFLVIEKG